MLSLSEQLDRLSSEHGALLTEARQTISVAALSADDARQLSMLCRDLGWDNSIYDSASTLWEVDSVSSEFEPFRITIQKPNFASDSLLLLTNTGFDQWLKSEEATTRWSIARLTSPIETHGRIYCPWGYEDSFVASAPTKSPRSLVREYSAQRSVPADIRSWLLRGDCAYDLKNSAFKVWASSSARAIVQSLADEIDSEDQTLKFRGPPRLSLTPSSPEDDPIASLGKPGFDGLQDAARWVYEDEHSAEMRHILLATEIARSGTEHKDVFICLNEQIASALEGAKIAYQMSLADLSRDTLKSLTDLRKAITEETAKVTEAIRQLTASVAGALAVGISLFVLRLTTNTLPILIVVVMLVVAMYVGMVIFSGHHYIRLQRSLRKEWRQRLYRFLPQNEYEKLVTLPAHKVERTFNYVAVLSILAVLILAAVVIYSAAQPKILSGYEFKGEQSAAHALGPITNKSPQQIPTTPSVIPPEATATEKINTNAAKSLKPDIPAASK